MESQVRVSLSRENSIKIVSYRFNNLTGQFPAIYLTSSDGRHTPGSMLGMSQFGRSLMTNNAYYVFFLLDDTPGHSSKKKPPVNQHDSDDVLAKLFSNEH